MAVMAAVQRPRCRTSSPRWAPTARSPPGPGAGAARAGDLATGEETAFVSTWERRMGHAAWCTMLQRADCCLRSPAAPRSGPWQMNPAATLAATTTGGDATGPPPTTNEAATANIAATATQQLGPPRSYPPALPIGARSRRRFSDSSRPGTHVHMTRFSAPLAHPSHVGRMRMPPPHLTLLMPLSLSTRAPRYVYASTPSPSPGEWLTRIFSHATPLQSRWAVLSYQRGFRPGGQRIPQTSMRI